MEILLRELQSRADGLGEFHDTEFSGERIAIGSAADSTIQLLGTGVAAQHAVIGRAGERLELRCMRGSRARVNGTECTASPLTIGDVVEIAANRLTIARAPSGFDFTVEIQPDLNVELGEFEHAFRTDLEQAWLSKRRLSWFALALVVALGLAIPLAGVLLRGEQAAALPFVPSDALWSSGNLVPGHAQAAGERCNHCHEKLFVQVRDAACGECHQNIVDHVSADHAALANLGAPQRCASCHREHGESSAEIIVRTDKVCTGCHAQAATQFAALKMPNVQSFEPQQHPPFSANLLVPIRSEGGAGALLDWKIVKSPLDGAREQSNLEFSHEFHLDATKVVRQSDSEALGCKDCHQLAPDGQHFAPLTMQSTCSSCHELAFDASAPERQLPHGKPREVILTLQEYFARRYADPVAAPVVRERRRLPGRELRDFTCKGGVLECARQSASSEISRLFAEAKTGCQKCHTVNDTRDADIYERFQVLPVRLSGDFFPAARFDHRAHSIQKDQIGDAACLTCHAASTAKLSSNLLLPADEHCMKCHRTTPQSGQGGEQIMSQCVSCHSYHPRASGAQNLSQNTSANRSGGVTSTQP